MSDLQWGWCKCVRSCLLSVRSAVRMMQGCKEMSAEFHSVVGIV